MTQLSLRLRYCHVPHPSRRWLAWITVLPCRRDGWGTDGINNPVSPPPFAASVSVVTHTRGRRRMGHTRGLLPLTERSEVKGQPART